MFEYRKTAVVSAEVMEIGPKEATKMLEMNAGNRKLRTSVVLEYASYMKNGLWRENGEAIRISEEGIILNGQHRLHAVIAANLKVKFLVVTIKAIDNNGELTPMSVIQDRGSMRSHSDITGIPSNCDAVAGIMIRELSGKGNNNVLAKNTALRASVYYAFQKEMDYFFSKCNISARRYSLGAIKAIFILRLKQGYDYTDMYHSILTDLVGLPNAWMSWYKRLERSNGSAFELRKIALVSTWMLTDPLRDTSKNLALRSDLSAPMAEIKAQFKGYCGELFEEVSSTKTLSHKDFVFKKIS